MPSDASPARVSIKLLLRSDKSRADGTAPVYLRATANRKSRYTSTGVYVKPKQWNENKQEVRASHDLYEALNAKLARIKNKATTTALNASTAAAVKAELDGSGGPSGSLSRYFQSFVDARDAPGQIWEHRKYKGTLAKLHTALGNPLGWSDVDREALSSFERYLRVERKNSPNTTRKELTRLGRVFKQAVRDGVIQPGDDPFLVYEKPKGQRVQRRKLTLEQVEALGALGEADGLSLGPREELVRDAFVFSFYAGGMRFGDVCCLKAKSVANGRARYRMMKNGKPMDVPLPASAEAIASRYVSDAPKRDEYLFGFLRVGDDIDGDTLRRRISSRNAQANALLKKIAVLADIEPDGLTFHVARHSFADYARRMSGDLYKVSKALGHSNLQTTEIYLKEFDQDAVDSLAEDIWNE